jgi:hypothetical protein
LQQFVIPEKIQNVNLKIRGPKSKQKAPGRGQVGDEPHFYQAKQDFYLYSRLPING